MAALSACLSWHEHGSAGDAHNCQARTTRADWLHGQPEPCFGCDDMQSSFIQMVTLAKVFNDSFVIAEKTATSESRLEAAGATDEPKVAEVVEFFFPSATSRSCDKSVAG